MRTVLATFADSEGASRAAGDLVRIGAEAVQLDRISRYGVEMSSGYDPAFSAGSGGQSGLTVYSSSGLTLSGTDRRVLLSADPSVSGIGDKNYGAAGAMPFLVTARISDDKMTQVEEIVEKYHGRL